MLEKIIGSQSRAEIFRKLFTKDAPTFYLRKLAREAGFSAPVIHRELRNLLDLGLVHQNTDGNRINFSANRKHPLFPVICKLVEKTDHLEHCRLSGLSPDVRFSNTFSLIHCGNAIRR